MLFRSVDGNGADAKIYAMETLVIALGIAAGIVVISLMFYHVSHKNIQYKVRFDQMVKSAQKEAEASSSAQK